MGIPKSFLTDIIYLPPVLEGLGEDDFWQYIDWQSHRGEIPKMITAPFKNQNLSPFTDDNPPEKPKPTRAKFGSVVFGVLSKKKTKRPRYADIYSDFEGFLTNLKESYERGTLRKDYRTIEEDGKKELYVSLDTVAGKLREDKNTMLSEKEGVDNKISLLKPAGLSEEVLESITIVADTDYSARSEYNARIYQLASNFLNQGDINTGFSQKKEAGRRFKKILLEDSFERLGGRPETFVKVPYPFGSITFKHHIKPKSQPSYETMINAFLHPIPKTIKKGSLAGDFSMLEGLKSPGLRERLKEKGIWDEEFEQTYRPRLISGRVYILLEGVMKRLEYYRNRSISTSYDQHVSVGRTI